MIEIQYITLPISRNSGNSDIPSIGKNINVQNVVNNNLSEEEGLFLGYGTRHNSYPYTTFDRYGKLEEAKTKVAVLENEYMRAVFLLEFGGRLWSCVDKTTGQNILYTNDCIKLGNLAIRNAWFSGGVEWNMGFVGHSPFTCQNVYAETLTADGREILRIYEFERVRQVSWQIDFWLNEQKPRLYARVRLVNKELETKPMYWWSNIASPQFKNGRVFASAKAAYKTDVLGVLSKQSAPYDESIQTDISYYNNLYHQVDYFFDTEDREKFIANIDGKGQGLLQYSTKRLKGRKLFYWGNKLSSQNWQNILTENAGNYIEVQAGLAKTQYESIPMPQRTAWEWIECYESARLTEEYATMDFQSANELIEKRVSDSKMEDRLEEMVTTTKKAALTPGKLIHCGSGFGYLYNLVNPNKLDEHLQFSYRDDIREFVYLVENGTLPDKTNDPIPLEFAYSEEIQQLLKRAIADKGKENWYNYYQLAMLENDNDNIEYTLSLVRKSRKLNDNVYNAHLLMSVLRKIGDRRCISAAAKVFTYPNYTYTIAVDALGVLLKYQQYAQIDKIVRNIDKDFGDSDRLKLFRVFALANMNQVEEAERLFYDNGGLFVVDIREGEDSIDEAYLLVQRKKYPDQAFDYKDVPLKFLYKLKS